MYIYKFIHSCADKCPITGKEESTRIRPENSKFPVAVRLLNNPKPLAWGGKNPVLAPPVGPLGRYWRAQVCKAPMAEHLHGKDKKTRGP